MNANGKGLNGKGSRIDDSIKWKKIDHDVHSDINLCIHSEEAEGWTTLPVTTFETLD